MMAPDCRPRLPRGCRLRHDGTRDRWTLLAPERVFELDPVAAEVLRRCDGATAFAAIVDDLADVFAADRERVETDVGAMLASLHEKKVLDL